ncbi:MAG: CtsR family transcriptional regulator [Syntrophomonadaceae bacterium]|jgi:transcriptional regulator CtsR|nr:CtsR family transcriptional regulator [Syntrophomonadaceae bacterium]
MRSLSDRIEKYLKVLIERSENEEVEIQRIELAETFRCAPSQITYVLATRFTASEGFITESKRGGGGFIKIRKFPLDENSVKTGISETQAENTLQDLKNSGFLTGREAFLLREILGREVLDPASDESDYVRFKILHKVMKLIKEMEGQWDVL